MKQRTEWVSPATPAHDRREVESVKVSGIWLGRQALDQFPWEGSRGLLINPTDAMNRRSPANVAALDANGTLCWVIPLDWSRIVLGPFPTDSAGEMIFAMIWQDLRAAVATSSSDESPIWGTGRPVGDAGVELGATSTRPDGHPWLTLGVLSSGLQVLCALSNRASSQKRYQAWFDRSALLSTRGELLREKSGVLNPADGAAELSHFAVLDPAAEGWEILGAMAHGDGGARGRAHIVDRWLNVWPTLSGSSVRLACDSHGRQVDMCDSCAKR